MSRTSLLATTAIAVLGTASLIPVDAMARTATSYAPHSAAVRSVSVSRPVTMARPMARPTFTSTSHVANMARLPQVNATNNVRNNGTVGVGGLNVRNNATTTIGGLNNVRNSATNPVVGPSNLRIGATNTVGNAHTFARTVAATTPTAPTAPTPSTAKQITDLMNKATANRTEATNTIALVNNINKGADAAAAEAQRQRNIAASSQVLANSNPGNAKDEFKFGLQASLKAVEFDKKAADLRADAAARLKAVPGLLARAAIEARLANNLANGGGTDGGNGNGTPPTPGNTPSTPGNTPSTPGNTPGNTPSTPGTPTTPGNGNGTVDNGNTPGIDPNGNGNVTLPGRIVIRPIIRPGFGSGFQPGFQPGFGPAVAQPGPAVQTLPPGQMQLAQGPSPAPQSAGCLQKSYLQAGFVMFNDVCTNERAVNSTTTQVASAANCLTKQNPQNGGVLFQDKCTGEWAQN